VNSPSAWKLLRDHPPALIRLFSRRVFAPKHVRAVSIQEIAIASGMPLSRVKEIAQSVTWDDVTITEAERFCVGCNFDPLNPVHRNRQSAYERTCKTRPHRLEFLLKAPWWESELKPLIEKLRRAKNSAPSGSAGNSARASNLSAAG
jgi:hypothetical protein